MLTDNEINNYRLLKNDLICIRVNGSADLVGRIVSINEDMEIAYCDHFIRFKLFNNIVSPSYVQHFFNTHGVRRYVELNKVSSAGQNTVNQEMLSTAKVAICCLEEQKAIVGLLEEKLSEVDQLEQTIATSLQQAEALRQSILKKAFSGQLVAQDTNDEPASVLLERIKAERDAQSVTAKSRKLQKVQLKPAPVKTNVIPFPVKLANISTTDLHAGILARAYQHHEYTPKYLAYFGHVKAEKIAHLVEAHLGIDLGREPIKAAAGPNDYPHLKKIESRAQKANWFNVRQKKDGGAYVFTKGRSFDALLFKTKLALGDHAAAVDELMSLLLPLNTRQAEIVATLYAAWNNLLLHGGSPSDEEIVYEARESWHASKLGIEREKFFRGLEWMRQKGLVPAGNGRHVGKKK
ncbi:MAG: type I restriction endonuclease subunit S [Gallionella sp.]|nr:type I restriction endonuclease subunit S [Gallionella sp.]